MWNCIEDRIDDGTKYGRIIRKFIFGEIFADRTAVLSSNPIPRGAMKHLKRGDKVVYYESEELLEGAFLCSSETEALDPQMIVGTLLSTESDLKAFCKQYGLFKENLFLMAIEAYKYFLNVTNERPNNTESPSHVPQTQKLAQIGQKRKMLTPKAPIQKVPKMAQPPVVPSSPPTELFQRILQAPPPTQSMTSSSEPANAFQSEAISFGPSEGSSNSAEDKKSQILENLAAESDSEDNVMVIQPETDSRIEEPEDENEEDIEEVIQFDSSMGVKSEVDRTGQGTHTMQKSSELAHSQSEEPKMEIIHLGQNQNQLVSNSLMADPRDSFNLGMGQSDYPKTVCQMDLPITDQTPKKTKYAINGSPESQEKTKKYLADCKKGLIKPICVPWDKEEYLVKRSGPFSSSEQIEKNETLKLIQNDNAQFFEIMTPDGEKSGSLFCGLCETSFMAVYGGRPSYDMQKITRHVRNQKHTTRSKNPVNGEILDPLSQSNLFSIEYP